MSDNDKNTPPAFMPELNTNHNAPAIEQTEAPDEAHENPDNDDKADPIINERPNEKSSKFDALRLWWDAQPDWYRPIGIGTVAILIFFWVISIIWSMEPDLLNVRQLAQDRATEKQQLVNGKPVIGYTTTLALMEITNTMMDKTGGYLSNDVLPPSLMMDNMPSWEFGVLQQVRLFTKSLRYEMSRAQTLDQEQKDLQDAEPLFNIDNTAWMVPAAEVNIKKALKL